MRAHFVNDPQFIHSDDPAKVEHAALHARIAELEANHAAARDAVAVLEAKVAELTAPPVAATEASLAVAPPEAPTEAPIVG